MKSSVSAAGDLSAKKYFIAQNDANGKLVLADAATKGLVGVIEDGGSAAGDPVSVRGPSDGPGSVKLGGTITLSATLPIYLTTDASGNAIATTTGGNVVIGYALEGGSSGDIVKYQPCFFKHP
jgi:hypothetical protein